MYIKVKISGILETVTGLHIGTGGAYTPIGSADLPVVRDPIGNLPMIPGSSLKGKIRTLLSRTHSERDCKVSEDPQEIQELFGSQQGRSKVLFSDMFLNSDCRKRLEEMEIYAPTEVKFENTINRLTAVANPRQIERVIRGSQFDLDIIREAADENEMLRFIKLISEGLRLLTLDYLGGNGSRGYGKIKFSNLSAACVFGSISDEVLSSCNQTLKAAEML